MDLPHVPHLKPNNATSMLTLTGSINDLGTQIHHQTMMLDTHIADRVQGFINGQPYLSAIEKSLLGEFYAMQLQLALGLMNQVPLSAKFTLKRHAKRLLWENAIEVAEFEDLLMDVDNRD
jgi:hypothetical protein